MSQYDQQFQVCGVGEKERGRKRESKSVTEVALLCLSNLVVFSTSHFVCFDTNNLEPRRQLEPKGYGGDKDGRGRDGGL